ncbi:hypothetical protein BY458DRAFT_487124 [Sporodiniella umbellata]|nr:hypothetical protein BY458DRAFT_487124 [Sporodiniella umbellata]
MDLAAASLGQKGVLRFNNFGASNPTATSCGNSGDASAIMTTNIFGSIYNTVVILHKKYQDQKTLSVSEVKIIAYGLSSILNTISDEASGSLFIGTLLVFKVSMEKLAVKVENKLKRPIPNQTLSRHQNQFFVNFMTLIMLFTPLIVLYPLVLRAIVDSVVIRYKYTVKKKLQFNSIKKLQTNSSEKRNVFFEKPATAVLKSI